MFPYYIFAVFAFADIGVEKIDSSSVSTPSGGNSNVQFSVTQKGLDYGSEMFKAILKKDVEGLETSTVKKSAGWWSPTLTLKTPKIKKIDLKSSSFRFDNGVVKIKVTLSQVEVVGSYTFSFFSGTFSSKMSEISIEIHLGLDKTKQGRPSIVNKRWACSTRIPADRMVNEFKGGSSILLNIGVSLLKSSVKSGVENEICRAIKESIKKKSAFYINQYFKPFSLIHVPCAKLSFLVAKDPDMKNYYVDYMLNGKLQTSCNPSIPTMTSSQSNMAASPRHVPTKDRMVSLSLSDEFLNSLLNIYHQKDLFIVSMNVTKQSLGSAFVTIKPTYSPVISTSSVNGSLLLFNATATFNHTSPSGKNTVFNDDFVIRGVVVFNASTHGNRKSLSGKLENLRIVASNAGSKGKQFVKEIVSDRANEALQKTLDQMIPLPMVGNVKLLNHVISYSERQVVLATDANLV